MFQQIFSKIFGTGDNSKSFSEISQGTVIDVRTGLEFKMGHHPQAINIPLPDISLKVEEIKKMPKPLLLCCASGARSGQATHFLKSAGIQEIKNCGPWTNVSA